MTAVTDHVATDHAMRGKLLSRVTRPMARRTA
jgi:hypothetical protein